MRKEFFTTGLIAKITGAAPRTVSKWIDTNLLQGFTCPGTPDRRVKRGILAEFLNKHGYGTDKLDMFDYDKAILIFDLNEELFRGLNRDYVIIQTDDYFTFGYLLGHHKPSYLIISEIEGNKNTLRDRIHNFDNSVKILSIKSQDDIQKTISQLLK